MRVSLVVTTYNWKQALFLALRALAAQSRLPDEVVVADDGSDADTRAMLEATAVDYPVPLRHAWHEHQGFRVGETRNRAVAAAQGDYVILLDGDMLAQRELVADHLAAARPRCFTQGMRALAGPLLSTRLLADGRFQVSPFSADLRARTHAMRMPVFAWLRRPHDGGRKRVMSCNQGFWRDDLLEVNGFDERIAGWGREDTELGVRCYHAGIRRLQLRHVALAVHLDHPPRGHGGARTGNEIYLADSERERRTHCELGIDRHLGAPALPDLRAQA